MPKIFKAPFYTDEEIESLDEKDMFFPYSCKFMYYDGLKRQYIPTEELLTYHGVDLNSFLDSRGEDWPISINNELEYISDQIYSFIGKSSGSRIQTLKWIIARGIKLGMSPFRFRLAFMEVLWKQARYYVYNDDPNKTTGIDVEQKQYLNKGIMNTEDRHIDPKIKILLKDLGLTFAGSYDRQFGLFITNEDW